jgi:hypothetical protein
LNGSRREDKDKFSLFIIRADFIGTLPKLNLGFFDARFALRDDRFLRDVSRKRRQEK